MYHAKIWDEDKWNIHSKSYGSSKYGNIFKDGKKEEDKAYHEQKYGQKDSGSSSDYMRKEEQKEKDDKKDDFLDAVDEDKKEKNELKEEDIPFKAAKQVFSENKGRPKEEKKKDLSTIDDAIKKAIEQEKKVIVMD